MRQHISRAVAPGQYVNVLYQQTLLGFFLVEALRGLALDCLGFGWPWLANVPGKSPIVFQFLKFLNFLISLFSVALEVSRYDPGITSCVGFLSTSSRETIFRFHHELGLGSKYGGITPPGRASWTVRQGLCLNASVYPVGIPGDAGAAPSRTRVVTGGVRIGSRCVVRVLN